MNRNLATAHRVKMFTQIDRKELDRIIIKEEGADIIATEVSESKKGRP